jgi:hypothetical protein
MSHTNPRFAAARRRSPGHLKTDVQLCCYCQTTPAAVTVHRSSRTTLVHRKNTRLVAAAAAQHYCLLHYYSTSAVRESTVAVLDPVAAQLQFPGVQDLFSEAFVQLQQQLSEETARAYASHATDPLAVLHDLHFSSTGGTTTTTATTAKTTTDALVQSSKRKRGPTKPPPKPAAAVRDDSNDGGFMRARPELPARLLRTQQQQALYHDQLTRRIMAASSSGGSRIAPNDQTARRKPTRKSIWNVIIESGDRPRATKEEKRLAVADEVLVQEVMMDHYGTVECTCGSSRVNQLSSNSSRNQDATKGEIWGTKDRADEVMTRCQCIECGKIWNESA